MLFGAQFYLSSLVRQLALASRNEPNGRFSSAKLRSSQFGLALKDRSRQKFSPAKWMAMKLVDSKTKMMQFQELEYSDHSWWDKNTVNRCIAFH
ncbi:hypothetical protein QR98_0017050 [Sarcoptes scabiei]|uniref:Uncharacterized protein n=1 Tax=Sarcoptes scabiei TaxID=52283 RepID=A0A131ZYA2_SARSC|nr:hypothetical protein QR98_0017050 [Sarcoptes scabiei]